MSFLPDSSHLMIFAMYSGQQIDIQLSSMRVLYSYCNLNFLLWNNFKKIDLPKAIGKLCILLLSLFKNYSWFNISWDYQFQTILSRLVNHLLAKNHLIGIKRLLYQLQEGAKNLPSTNEVFFAIPYPVIKKSLCLLELL